MLSCHGTVQVKYATPAASSYGMISLGLLLVTGLRPVRERSCRHRPGTVTGNGNPAQNYLLWATSLLTTEPVRSPRRIRERGSHGVDHWELSVSADGLGRPALVIWAAGSRGR